MTTNQITNQLRPGLDDTNNNNDDDDDGDDNKEIFSSILTFVH